MIVVAVHHAVADHHLVDRAHHDEPAAVGRALVDGRPRSSDERLDPSIPSTPHLAAPLDAELGDRLPRQLDDPVTIIGGGPPALLP